MPEFLTLEDLSSVIGAPVGTLRHWRVTGYGPKSAKIGRRVLYRRSDVESWLDNAFTGSR
jgi:predicted DNA-binding transcriptional regulator AlpA